MDTQDTNERWNEIRRLHRQYKFFYIVGGGFLLILLGIWLGWQIFPSGKIIDYNINLWNTLIGAGITVLVIERLNQRRTEKQLKRQLIREMGNADNGIALRAVKELQSYGWGFRNDTSLEDAYLAGANLQASNDLREINLKGAWMDGVNLRDAYLLEGNFQRTAFQASDLSGADFSGADLQNAYFGKAVLVKTDLRYTDLRRANFHTANLRDADLTGADLQGATLYKCNLEGASITDEQLATVSELAGALLPDGARYDGHLNLYGDIISAKQFNVDTENPIEMSKYYLGHGASVTVSTSLVTKRELEYIRLNQEKKKDG